MTAPRQAIRIKQLTSGRQARAAIGLLIVAMAGYGFWGVTKNSRRAASGKNIVPASAHSLEQAYTDLFSVSYRQSPVRSNLLVEAVYYPAALAAALRNLPQKTEYQAELSRHITELNSDGSRYDFIVTLSAPSGDLPSDEKIETARLVNEQNQSYPLFSAQRIYASPDSGAQKTTLVQKTYLLIFNPPTSATVGAANQLNLALTDLDKNPRQFSWDLRVVSLLP